MSDRMKLFHDSSNHGAWPFAVGGVICLVDSVNERDVGFLFFVLFSEINRI